MAFKIFCLVCSVTLLQIYSIRCSPLTTTTPVTTTINISDELEEVENHTLVPGSPEIEVEALKFLKEVNKKSYKAYNDLAVASWNYETNITDETESTRVYICF